MIISQICHDQVKCSTLMRSETKTITSLCVRAGDLPGSKLDPDTMIVVCDSPGFGDTEGHEVDIANGIGIARAVRRCKKVKPLILFPADAIGSKYEKVTEVGATMTRFVGSIQKYLPSFSYAFTKFDKSEQQAREINAAIRNKLVNLSKKEKVIVFSVFFSFFQLVPKALVLNLSSHSRQCIYT